MNQPITLEYNPEDGLFHFLLNGEKPRNGANGYYVVADTTWNKDSIFTSVMNQKLNRYTLSGNKPYTLSYIKDEWAYFCQMFDRIIEDYCK